MPVGRRSVGMEGGWTDALPMTAIQPVSADMVSDCEMGGACSMCTCVHVRIDWYNCTCIFYLHKVFLANTLSTHSFGYYSHGLFQSFPSLISHLISLFNTFVQYCNHWISYSLSHRSLVMC